MKSGIYSIVINNKIYIGSAKNISSRKSKHKNELRLNRHPNENLQKAFNECKEFKFEILEYCENLLEREQYWMDFTKCYEIGYNISRFAGSRLGHKHSEEVKQRIGLGNKGKIISDETKMKLSESQKGKIIPEHQKKAISEANKKRKGRKYTKSKIIILNNIILD